LKKAELFLSVKFLKKCGKSFAFCKSKAFLEKALCDNKTGSTPDFWSKGLLFPWDGDIYLFLCIAKCVDVLQILLTK